MLANPGALRLRVRFAVKAVTGEQLEGIKAAIFAFRHKEYGESVKAFLSLWTDKRDLWEEFADCFGVPFTTEAIEQALAAGNTEARSLEVLKISRTSVAEWQEARLTLGMEPHRFEKSGCLWTEMRNQVAAILKAAVARRTGADFKYAKSVIEALNESAIPEKLSLATPDVPTTLSAVIDRTEGLLKEDDSKARTVFERALELMRDSPEVKSRREVKVGEMAPARDVEEYLDDDVNERSRRAGRAPWGRQLLKNRKIPRRVLTMWTLS